jgi:23S rRNA (uridine2479-2'-O)-methyltransferase
MSPIVKKIFSENADYQQIEALKKNREKRQKQRTFFVEGVRSINQALQYKWKVSAFIYSKDLGLSDWAKHILKASTAEVHFELSRNLMLKLSNKQETSELIALIYIPEDRLSRIQIKKDLLVVIFDRPSSPGNLGTLIRSCESFKVGGLIITGHSVDLYSPETINATVGSLFSMPVIRVPSHKELLPWFETIRESIGSVQIVGSSAKGDKTIWTHNFNLPTILIVGNETWGISANYKALCDVMVRIPIYGSASSLNVACATSIILYEIDRQRTLMLN